MMSVPARFNAASFFVDRHVAEGRADKVAFFHDGGSITYGALQELVNRAGNALLDLGVRPEQRVLCLLLDSPEFLATFWGAIKIGAIPIPANTMMRSDDYRYFLDDSRAPVAVVSEPLLAEAGPALPGARFLRHVVVAGRASGSPDRVRRLGGQGEPAARALRRLQGRSRVLALLVGLDRPSQGRGPPAARHGGVRRDLREAGPGHDRGRSHRLGGQALLRLRDGQQHDLPAPGGRPGRAVPAPAHARRDVRADPPPPAHAVLRRAHALRGDAAGEGGREALRPLVPAPLRLGGGGAARGALPPLAGALRGGDPRRHRHHRDPPHLPLEPAGPRPPGLDRPGGAGLRGAGGGRRGPPDARGGDRQPAGQGRLDDGLLLEPAREDEGHPARATGSRPATSTTRTPTATSGTAGAATTC